MSLAASLASISSLSCAPVPLAARFTNCALLASCPLTCCSFVLLQVRGEVHHDRRLHQLMLQEGEKAWNSSRSLPSKPRSARVDIAGRTSISSVALSSPSDSAGSMHAADCSPLDLADPLAVYRWGWGALNGVSSAVMRCRLSSP